MKNRTIKIIGIWAVALLMTVTLTPMIISAVPIDPWGNPCPPPDEPTDPNLGGLVSPPETPMPDPNDCAAIQDAINRKIDEINKLNNAISNYEAHINNLQNRLADLDDQIADLNIMKNLLIDRLEIAMNEAFAEILIREVSIAFVLIYLADILLALRLVLSGIIAGGIATFVSYLMGLGLDQRIIDDMMSAVQPWLDQIDAINQDILVKSRERERTRNALNRARNQLNRLRDQLAKAQNELNALLDLQSQHCLQIPHNLILSR